MHANFMVCNCKQVSYYDIMNALDTLPLIDDVLSAFNSVQAITHCSTGCGGCYDKVLDVISDAMYGYESYERTDCKL